MFWPNLKFYWYINTLLFFKSQGWCYGGLGLVLPILLLLSLIVANATREAMRLHIGPGADIVYTVMVHKHYNISPIFYSIYL